MEPRLPSQNRFRGYRLQKDVRSSILYEGILLYMETVAVKHPPISVNKDLICIFYRELNFEMIYIFIRPEKTLFGKRKTNINSRTKCKICLKLTTEVVLVSSLRTMNILDMLF